MPLILAFEGVLVPVFNPPTTMLYAVFARLVALMLLAVPTAFLTPAAGTERHDDANRSIGQTYCVGTTRNCPYAAAGIVVCTTRVDTMCRVFK